MARQHEDAADDVVHSYGWSFPEKPLLDIDKWHLNSDVTHTHNALPHFVFVNLCHHTRFFILRRTQMSE